MQKKIRNSIILVIAIALSIYSWVSLPDVVAVQIGFDGNVSNALPKPLAISLALVITIFGIFKDFTTKEEKDYKGLVVAIVGILVLVLTLIFNI